MNSIGFGDITVSIGVLIKIFCYVLSCICKYLESVPDHDRGVLLNGLYSHFRPKPFYDSMTSAV